MIGGALYRGQLGSDQSRTRLQEVPGQLDEVLPEAGPGVGKIVQILAEVVDQELDFSGVTQFARSQPIQQLPDPTHASYPLVQRKEVVTLLRDRKNAVLSTPPSIDDVTDDVHRRCTTVRLEHQRHVFEQDARRELQTVRAPEVESEELVPRRRVIKERRIAGDVRFSARARQRPLVHRRRPGQATGQSLYPASGEVRPRLFERPQQQLRCLRNSDVIGIDEHEVVTRGSLDPGVPSTPRTDQS